MTDEKTPYAALALRHDPQGGTMTNPQEAASVAPTPGACADPSCPVLHTDPANPIHPPDYEPGGPLFDNEHPSWCTCQRVCGGDQ